MNYLVIPNLSCSWTLSFVLSLMTSVHERLLWCLPAPSSTHFSYILMEYTFFSCYDLRRNITSLFHEHLLLWHPLGIIIPLCKGPTQNPKGDQQGHLEHSTSSFPLNSCSSHRSCHLYMRTPMASCTGHGLVDTLHLQLFGHCQINEQLGGIKYLLFMLHIVCIVNI